MVMHGHLTRAFKVLRHWSINLPLILLLVIIFLGMSNWRGYAQGSGEEEQYYEDFDDLEAQGWDLEEGWKVEAEETTIIKSPTTSTIVSPTYTTVVSLISSTIVSENKVLRGSGHYWARYTEGVWEDFRVSFRLRIEEKGSRIHFNYRLSEKGRYYIGFHEFGVYLSKEAPPGTFKEELDESDFKIYQDWHNILIIGEGPRILVVVDGSKVLEYIDSEPLLSGTIAFETLENSVAVVDDIDVSARARTVTITTTATTTTTTIKMDPTTVVSTTTVISTTTKEVVPPVYYVYTILLVGVAGGVGAAAVHFLGKGTLSPSVRAPPLTDLSSVSRQCAKIENLGKARVPSPLSSVRDVEKLLRSIRGSVNKVRDVLKRLKAVKDEEEAVEVLVEFVEQIRNSSDDVGSFIEFLAQRVAGDEKGKVLPWFNVLTGNLRDMESALDKANIMVRPYALGALLFEGLTRTYTFLVSSALEVEGAFTLEDIDQIDVALNTLRKAKSELESALGGVCRGLADWYSRLKLEKYWRATVALVKE